MKINFKIIDMTTAISKNLLNYLELFRPRPLLARPPLLAISRCFSGSIAAKPRLLLFCAIMLCFL